MKLIFKTIVETVKNNFPELYDYEECRQRMTWADEDDNLAYVFFPAFWKLLEISLLNKNKSLYSRIFIFMEEMAKSDDGDVNDLMQIEMLEPLFGMEYELYRTVTKQLLLPKTVEYYLKVKLYFNDPKPR